MPSEISFSIAAAVNNRSILANCLERSPDVASGRLQLRIYEGATCASVAYNRALDESDDEVMIFAHQDVYLPEGFLERFRGQIDQLNKLDPQWALAGVAGLDANGDFKGHTWDSGRRVVYGSSPHPVTEVITLDEMFIVLRRRSGVRFDESLPSFHLYAADAILAAAELGMSSYVIDVPMIHHSRPVVELDRGYHKAYRFMQKKWRRHLPVRNLICTISKSPLPLLIKNARLRYHYRGSARPPEPTDNPADIARELGFSEPGAS